MELKCPFCKKILNDKNTKHVNTCLENKEIVDKKEIRYSFISYNYKFISKKENLYLEYSINLMSLPDLKNKYNICFRMVDFLLDYHNIIKRNIKESSKLISQNKYKKTCLEKYGVDNVSKNELIKKKKKETFLINYGVDNIWKTEDFKKWSIENRKSWDYTTEQRKELYKNYPLEKKKNISNSHKTYWKNIPLNSERRLQISNSYSKFIENLSDEQRTLYFLSNINFSSKLETKIQDELNMLNVSYTRQFYIGRKIFDFKLENTKILIEIQGDFWHANPNKYKEEDILNHPLKKVSAKSIWEKDLIKKQMAEKLGYKVIYIWEEEINKSENLTDLILNKLNF